MYLIQSVLVSDEVVRRQFACNLAACHGACCWKGDYGAPLTAEELPILDEIYARVAPRLSPAGRAAIAERGRYHYDEELGEYVTPLVAGGPCAYMTLDRGGTAHCGLEAAYNAGEIPWRKPISCHLYPIRVKPLPGIDSEALNYDRWDICSAACSKGEREGVRVYEFARDALLRRYGQDWYDELAAAVAHAGAGTGAAE